MDLGYEHKLLFYIFFTLSVNDPVSVQADGDKTARIQRGAAIYDLYFYHA
jgi:hypothetical protein